MKSSRFRYSYRTNASKLHRAVGDILRTSPVFKGFKSYQEYPVNKVNLNYPTGRHHFDWVIPDLKIVIEVMGEQHSRPVAFDGDLEAAEERFELQKVRDLAKKAAALEAGYHYIIVPYYWDLVNLQDLLENAILESVKQPEALRRSERIYVKSELDLALERRREEQRARERSSRQEYLRSDKHKKRLEQAREYRRQQYRKMKERNDGSV